MEDKIKSMYDEMYKSKQAALLKSKEQQLTDLANEETTNKGQYQSQRNSAAYDTTRNTQAIRDTMAKNNLLGSGENVDALLRNNTDYSNRVGTIDTNESNYKQNLLRQRNLVNSNYENDLNSAKSEIEAQKQQALIEYLNQIRQEQLAAANRSYSSGGSSSGYSSGSDTTYSKNGANTYSDALTSALSTATKSRDLGSATEILNDAKIALSQNYITQRDYDIILNRYSGLQRKVNGTTVKSKGRSYYASAN